MFFIFMFSTSSLQVLAHIHENMNTQTLTYKWPWTQTVADEATLLEDLNDTESTRQQSARLFQRLK
jgi:hypothetical protein